MHRRGRLGHSCISQPGQLASLGQPRIDHMARQHHDVELDQSIDARLALVPTREGLIDSSASADFTPIISATIFIAKWMCIGPRR